MHEMSICLSLLEEVERQAGRQYPGQPVQKVVVAIGPLSGVESQLLQRAFSIAQPGTIASTATLTIELTDVIVWCGQCCARTAAAPNALLCGRCGTWRVELKSGDELLLKRIELMDIAA